MYSQFTAGLNEEKQRSSMLHAVLTIGHSNHSSDAFIKLLSDHEVEVVVDVRSTPYSRFNPQFDREQLKRKF